MKTHPVFLSFFRLSVLSTQSYGYQAAKVLSPCAKKHLDGARLQQAGYGGEGGIRTHGAVASTRALQARRFVHSRTSPCHVGLS